MAFSTRTKIGQAGRGTHSGSKNSKSVSEVPSYLSGRAVTRRIPASKCSQPGDTRETHTPSMFGRIGVTFRYHVESGLSRVDVQLPTRPIQAPILNRLAHVRGLDLLCPGKIRDGPRHLQDPMVRRARRDRAARRRCATGPRSPASAGNAAASRATTCGHWHAGRDGHGIAHAGAPASRPLGRESRRWARR